MKSSSLAGSIFSLALLFAIGFYRSSSYSGLPDNAPEGALEYLQSEDERTWIALFPERLEMESPGPLGGHSEVEISQVKSIKKWGYKVIINTEKGQLSFDLTGLGGSSTAAHFVKTLKRLMEEENLE